ncbi:PREDICTED: putative transporter SVOPL [Branchiostoma belcheri]|uniref:Transporter SVOPL n=1 Tax=Branchiostoma belcheri TaxID=7741 RepID=A0A6P4YQY1_BRABE|nr:PREDICTED: putative transporter SVOPL [Branchiostoma belcheri]
MWLEMDVKHRTSRSRTSSMGSEEDDESQQPLLVNDDTEDPDVVDADDMRFFTVEDAVERVGFGRFQVMIIFFVGALSISNAMVVMMIAVLAPVLRCEWWLQNWQVALFTTMLFLGMLVFSIPFGTVADRYGRWPALWMVAFGMVLFNFLTAFSPNYYWVVILRTMLGVTFAGGPQMDTLLMEFMPSKYRAKAYLIYAIFWSLGGSGVIMLAYLVVPTLGWRYLILFSCIPGFFVLIFFKALPESVRFYMAAGKRVKALQVLERMARLNRATLPPGKLVKSSEAPRGTMKELFKRKHLRTLIQDIIIWCGTGALYYGIVLVSSEIMESKASCTGSAVPASSDVIPCSCKPLTSKDYISMIVSTYGEFIQMPINLLLVDIIGRKLTMTLNLALVCTFFMLLNLCTSAAWTTFFVFAVRAFISGAFSMVYIYTVEYFPTNVRALAIGTCSTVARVGAMTTPFIAQVLLNYSLSLALYVYGGLAGFCCLVALLLPQDTMGRKLQDDVHVVSTDPQQPREEAA